MSEPALPEVAHWSTRDVPGSSRLDYWAGAVSSAMIPLYVRNADSAGFESTMSAASLGPLNLVRQSGSPHFCGRGRSELARSNGRCFNLVMSLNSSYGLNHRNDLRLKAGDLALTDSEYPLEFQLRQWYEFINISLPVDWLRTWMSNPGVLVGRRIPGDSAWGKALSSYVAMLSPELVPQLPLARSAAADHVGALLGLLASEIGGRSAAAPGQGAQALRQRIADCIEQRCAERLLSAEQVAEAAGISLRTLHRVLTAHGETFGALLIAARIRCARRMLESPIFSRVTSAEIGRRAGFSDASHFVRMMRRHCGLTPQQWRAARGLPEQPTAPEGEAE